MTALGDIWVTLSWVLCLVSTGLCLYYGFRHWNEEETISPEEAREEEKWEQEERHINSELGGTGVKE